MIEGMNFEYTQDITVVNREQFEAHIRLYEGYIKKINEIDGILRNNPRREEANATFSFYRECKRGETFALNGVILHELYFENMGGREETNVRNPAVTGQLEMDFGSYSNWEEDFVATAKASRGWTVLCYDQRSYRLRNISLDAHDYGNIAYSAPILVLDVYEHAYFLQYADDKTEYINRFIENINWQIVGNRMGIY
ncbi:MAG: superoxide dismutase [Clostridiales bacterium]|jgi:Fe-Mn family superoxide dismutase|nr:superoxide dismutase [Clostridiales bacterium]